MLGGSDYRSPEVSCLGELIGEAGGAQLGDDLRKLTDGEVGRRLRDPAVVLPHHELGTERIVPLQDSWRGESIASR